MERTSVWDDNGSTVLLDDRLGQELLLSPTHRRATIGRLADFVVGGSDTHVHRHFLTVWNTGDGWALRNEGRFLSACVAEGTAGRPATGALALHPGDSVVLVPGKTAVNFATPKNTYEFFIRLRQTS